MERFEMERGPIAAEPLIVGANFPGEPRVRFHAETLESIRTKIDARGWYALPGLIIVSSFDDLELTQAIGKALIVERRYQYRPWKGSNHTRRRTEAIEPRVEYHGDPASCGENGWIDVAIHLPTGAIFLLTIETPPSIEHEMADGGYPSFYCPDLVVVPRLEREVIERAAAALIADDISLYGILADAEERTSCNR
jgi:hypothetical protein